MRIYSRSRINLGFGGVGYSRNLMCLKGRDFEVPMCRAVYLTQDNPELSSVFDVGNDIVTYRNERDCAATIRTLLDNPDRAEQIRAAGHRRCARDHTYQARWREVFELAGILASEEPTGHPRIRIDSNSNTAVAPQRDRQTTSQECGP